MNLLNDYLDNIESKLQQERMLQIDQWIKENMPQLQLRIAWNQPMYILDKTFIIAFSFAKNHISVAIETKPLIKFKEAIESAGYTLTKKFFHIPNDKEVDYQLLKMLIDYNMLDKKGYQKFWRENET